jgi:hypothetical protein
MLNYLKNLTEKKSKDLEESSSSEIGNEQSGKRNIVYRTVDRMAKFSLEHPVATIFIDAAIIGTANVAGYFIGESMMGSKTVHIPETTYKFANGVEVYRRAYDYVDDIGGTLGVIIGTWCSVPTIAGTWAISLKRCEKNDKP